MDKKEKSTIIASRDKLDNSRLVYNIVIGLIAYDDNTYSVNVMKNYRIAFNKDSLKYESAKKLFEKKQKEYFKEVITPAKKD